MKRCFLLFVLCSIAISSFSQYRDVKLPNKADLPEYPETINKSSGFWYAIEAEGGSSIMSSCKNMQYVQLNATTGYRVSEFLRLGVGVGGRMYVHNADVRDTSNKFGVALFANARGNLISAYDIDGVPFWSVNVGGITNEGFFASPTLGYSFGGLRNNFLIGISYTIVSFTDYTKTKMGYSYFALKLGYEF